MYSIFTTALVSALLLPPLVSAGQYQCEDINSNCERWGEEGACSPGGVNFKYMLANCCKTCRAFNSHLQAAAASREAADKKACQDEWESCKDMNDACDDPNKSVHCLKTCGMCEKYQDPDWCQHTEMMVDSEKFPVVGALFTMGRHIEDAPIAVAPVANLLGCSAFETKSLLGKVVVVQRGACYFSVKGRHIRDAGGIGMVLVDNDFGEDPVIMSGINLENIEKDLGIPAVSVSRRIGAVLINIVSSASEPTVTLSCPECRDVTWGCLDFYKEGECLLDHPKAFNQCAATCGFCAAPEQKPTAFPTFAPGAAEDKLWTLVGPGRCTAPEGVKLETRWMKDLGIGECENACMAKDDCLGFSVSPYDNCLLFMGRGEGAEIVDSDGDWGVAKCLKKNQLAMNDFTYKGQGWCRGYKKDGVAMDPEKRLRGKVRDDMSFGACAAECRLEGADCVGFAVALEDSAWEGKCYVYGNHPGGEGHWIDGWTEFTEWQGDYNLALKVAGASGYKGYACYSHEPSGKQCDCTPEAKPVCDKDGKQFPNICECECAGGQGCDRKMCKVKNCEEECDQEDFEPVCGEDNKTYSNKCMAKCGGVDYWGHGACYEGGKGGKLDFGLSFRRHSEHCKRKEGRACEECGGKYKMKRGKIDKGKCVFKLKKMKCKSLSAAYCEAAGCELSKKGKCSGQIGLN